MMSAAREPRWERRPQARTREIMDAAFEVFSERGYRATRLDEVARRAGATKGLIYHYFAGKEDLLVRTVADRLRTAFDGVARNVDRAERAPEARLRMVLRGAWEYGLGAEFGRMFRLVFAEVRAEHPALFQAWLTEGPLHGWGTIGELIQAGKEEGAFRRDVDPAAAARFITCGLAFQAVLQRHVRRGALPEVDVDHVFESTVDLFVRGLK